jgi:hypothetical protein
MKAILAILDGYKTYIVAVLIGALAILQALGYQVPESVWLLLNALGLGAVRDAIGKPAAAPSVEKTGA